MIRVSAVSSARTLCPDPLGDTGGDHDPYDYCVDDPVGCYDPNGLQKKKAWPPIDFWPYGPSELGMHIAKAGLYGSAWIADKIGELHTGAPGSKAQDGVERGINMVEDLFSPTPSIPKSGKQQKR